MERSLATRYMCNWVSFQMKTKKKQKQKQKWIRNIYIEAVIHQDHEMRSSQQNSANDTRLSLLSLFRPAVKCLFFIIR